MHPDYIDQLIRQEQQRDWQRDQEQVQLARVARSGRTRHSNVARAIVEWLHAHWNRARRQNQPTNKTQPTLAFKR